LKKAKKLTQTVPAVQATEAIAQESRMTMLKVCAGSRPDTIVASAAPEGHANSGRSMPGSFNMNIFSDATEKALLPVCNSS
jgi:hypothetical protein